MNRSESIERLIAEKNEIDKKIADLRFKNRIDEIAKELLLCSEDKLALIEGVLSSKKRQKSVPVASVPDAPVQQEQFIIMRHKNGAVFRSWNRSGFSKNEQRSLELFALLFNNGYHSYEILNMFGDDKNAGYINIVKFYSYSQIKNMILANIDDISSELVQQIDMI